MYALPRALPEYRDAKFSGEIIYSDRTHRVPQGGIDQGFVHNLGSLIRRIAAPSLPHASPAPRNAVSATSPWKDCPDRVQHISHPCEPATGDF